MPENETAVGCPGRTGRQPGPADHFCSHRLPPWPRLAAVLVGVVLVASACSGGQESSAGGSSTTTTSGGSGESTSTSGPGASSTVSEPADAPHGAIARPSGGCGSQPPALPAPEAPGDVPRSFESEGTARTYRLGVPTNYDPKVPAPLILNLHGSGSNALEQSIYSELALRGGERGFVVVTPDAVDGNWELPGEGADDTFIMALLDRVADDYCIDLNRVHTAGISLGAWKASITACTHPDRFASMALVAEEVAPPDCAVPVVAFHGTADPIVPYGEGADEGVEVTGANAGLSGVVVNMAAWAEGAGCSTDKAIEAVGAEVERWVFQDCPPGRGVEFYSVKGAGHVWPGSPIELPGASNAIDATAITLDWFEAHPRVD